MLANSIPKLRSALEKLLQVCQDLGFVINHRKSDLELKNRAKYLILVGFVGSKAFPTEPQISKFMEIPASFMTQRAFLPPFPFLAGPSFGLSLEKRLIPLLPTVGLWLFLPVMVMVQIGMISPSSRLWQSVLNHMTSLYRGIP